MKCKCCGKELGEFTLDIAYEMPDIVWSIPKEERKEKAKFNTDLCQYKGKNYLRGIAYIPIQGTDTNFGWGLWVEVNEDTFQKYLEVYEVDASKEPPVEGFLANTPPDYEDTNTLKVKIQFSSPTERPIIVLEPSEHKLALEQKHGISIERVHELNRYIS
jgi:hypothetical protein